jgi:hypothetical protein
MNLLPILLIGGAAAFVFREQIFGKKEDGDTPQKMANIIVSDKEADKMCPECNAMLLMSEGLGTKVKEGCQPCTTERAYRETYRESLSDSMKESLDGWILPADKPT